MILEKNYCVHCGKHSINDYLCPNCMARGIDYPALYRNDHTYHCSYCSDVLDRYFDFFPDGTFRSEEYHCAGCSFVRASNTFDGNREALPKALPILYKTQGSNIPVHIRQAYQRQYNEFEKRTY